MNIKFQGKTYAGYRDNLTGAITIKNGKVFAGFGVRNMVRGFSIVHTTAPKKAPQAPKKVG